MICHVWLAAMALGVGPATPTAPAPVDCLQPSVSASTVGPGPGSRIGILLDPDPHSARQAPDCDDPDADPWVAQLRDRMISFNLLVAHAIELNGSPLTCEGAVTSEFDGAKYGTLTLGFDHGMTFVVETMPPETSIVTLRTGSGFDDEVSARRLLETYSAGVGVDIDWESATETAEGEELVSSYWDPDPGLNASASLIFLDDTLVAIRFSMAL